MVFTSFLVCLDDDPFDNSSSSGMTVLSSNGASMTGGTNPGNPGWNTYIGVPGYIRWLVGYGLGMNVGTDSIPG